MTKVNSNPYFIFFANSIVVQKNRNTITKYQLITPFGFLPPPHGYESIICTEDSPEWSIKCTWLAAKVSLSWFFCLPRQLADLISLLFWWLISSAKILITIFSYFKCPMTHQFSSSICPANRLCFNQGRQTSQCHQSSDQPNSYIVRNQLNRTFWTFFARNYRTEPNRTLRLIVLHDFKQDSHLWSLWLIQCASWCSFHHECNCGMYILIQWVPWNWLLCKITTFVAKMGVKLCYRTC